MIVTRTLNAKTCQAPLTARAFMDIQEMDFHVQVWLYQQYVITCARDATHRSSATEDLFAQVTLPEPRLAKIVNHSFASIKLINCICFLLTVIISPFSFSFPRLNIS